MVVDTSVVIHVLYQEAGWQDSVAILQKEERRLISATSVIEAQAVITGRYKTSAEEALERLDKLILDLNLEPVPLSLKQAYVARQAYLSYGRGSGHPARLNYGDVMSYALAKTTGERLAFVGNDFQYTDLTVLHLPLDT